MDKSKFRLNRNDLGQQGFRLVEQLKWSFKHFRWETPVWPGCFLTPSHNQKGRKDPSSGAKCVLSWKQDSICGKWLNAQFYCFCDHWLPKLESKLKFNWLCTLLWHYCVSEGVCTGVCTPWWPWQQGGGGEGWKHFKGKKFRPNDLLDTWI